MKYQAQCLNHNNKPDILTTDKQTNYKFKYVIRKAYKYILYS